MYFVKEIFLTIQGEGAQGGRPSVFCRFSGCNLWNGREEDRAKAECSFCDTDFLGTNGKGGGVFRTACELISHIRSYWLDPHSAPYIVFTGGEPLLQLDDALLKEAHAFNCVAAVETNGTIAAPGGIDWLCVSPKAGTELIQKSGNELKLVYPQKLPKFQKTFMNDERIEVDPAQYLSLDFDHFFLQPMDCPQKSENIQAALGYCLRHPKWRLSIQAHKYLGIP